MFTKQFPLLSSSRGNSVFYALMQPKEDAFAVVADACLPFAGSFVRVHPNNTAARVALRFRAVHRILLMRYLAQVLNSVVCPIAIDVVNLIRRRIFARGKRPNDAMRQIATITDADTDMSAMPNHAAGNGAGLYASLRCSSVEQAITQLKQSMQLFNGRKSLRLGCHLNASEVATGQGVGSTAALQFYTGAAPC